MYTTDDLRRALAGATEDRSTRLSFADVKRAANRRRPRTVLAGIAIAVTPILATGGAIAFAPSAPNLAPSPDARRTALSPPGGSAPVGVSQFPADPSFPVPANVQLVKTGQRFGDHEELVLWLQDEMNGVQGGLYDTATGRLRTLGYTGLPRSGEFSWVVQELDDRHGGILDYGTFGGTDAKVKVKAGGRTTDATTAPVPGRPGVSVFWVRRTGVLTAPTGAVDQTPNDAVFTAYGPGGNALATSKQIQRTDDQVNFEDRSGVLGERMRTGITAAGGGELVFYFEGDDTKALLQAGSLDKAGNVTFLQTLGNIARPPFAIGFYRAVFTIASIHVRASLYVGTADRVQMGAEGATDRGSAAWSTDPQVKVAWLRTDQWPNGVAYDKAGNVVAATDFRT